MDAFDNMLTVPQVLPVAGMSANDAARLFAKSAGVNLNDPYGADEITKQVLKNLNAQGFEADPLLVKSMTEHILKSKGLDGGLVTKATDPVILQ